MPKDNTCDWCGRVIAGSPTSGTLTVNDAQTYLCWKCAIIATQSLMLGSQVAQLTRKGGVQLYVGVERTGQETELLSVKRWSPLESLESAEFADENLRTSQ